MTNENNKGRGIVMEEFILRVAYSASPDHLVHRGEVMADVGLPCPDPPPTDAEMQSVTYAAKMAMLKVLGKRPRTGPKKLTHAQERLRREGRYATCPACFAFRGVYVPLGGDGSMRVMRAHKSNGVRCDGSGEPAVGWE